MTKREAGRKGGETTFLRHGRDHMAKIGRLGAEATWKRYTLVPVSIANWAMVDRETGEVKAVW